MDGFYLSWTSRRSIVINNRLFGKINCNAKYQLKITFYFIELMLLWSMISQRIYENGSLHSIFKYVSVDLMFFLPSMLTASQNITLLWSTSLPVYTRLPDDINLSAPCSGWCGVDWLVTFCPPIYHSIQAAGRIGFVVHVNVCVCPSMIFTTLLSPLGVNVTVVTGTVI